MSLKDPTLSTQSDSEARSTIVSPKLAHYRYQTLAESTIRLLRVEITGGETCFSLIETDLDSAPPYVAISYVWGDPTLIHDVVLPSGTISITESFHVALRDVLDILRRNKDSLPEWNGFWREHVVHLWADSLCINQQDTQEKNLQVPMMTNIFSTASLVITYMGPKGDNSGLAINLVDKLTEFRFDKGTDLKEAYIFTPGYNLHELGLPPSHDPSWKALRKLLRRPWPTRVWIFQEFVVNKNTVLLCGDRTLPKWHDLWLTIGACYDKRLPDDLVITSGDDPSEQDEYPIDCLARLSYLRHACRGSDNSGRSLPLSALLFYCNRLGSSNLKDKVFALLNIANDREALGILVDYSPEVTTKDVYTATTVKIIEHEQKLDILSNAKVHKGDEGEHLPSWVTDWSGLEWTGLRTSVLRSTAQDMSKASGKSFAKVSFNAHYTELTSSGMIVDKLIPLSNCSHTEEAQSPYTGQWACIQEHVLQTGNSIYRTVDGIKKALRRALTYDTDHCAMDLTSSCEYDFNMGWSGFPSAFATLSPEQQSLALQIEKRVNDTSNGRPYGVTSKGYICVLAEGIEPGDLIAVLSGGRVPYALRGIEGGKYLFLGEVYVQGLMKGEALLLGDLSEQITLV